MVWIWVLKHRMRWCRRQLPQGKCRLRIPLRRRRARSRCWARLGHLRCCDTRLPQGTPPALVSCLRNTVPAVCATFTPAPSARRNHQPRAKPHSLLVSDLPHSKGRGAAGARVRMPALPPDAVLGGFLQRIDEQHLTFCPGHMKKPQHANNGLRDKLTKNLTGRRLLGKRPQLPSCQTQHKQGQSAKHSTKEAQRATKTCKASAKPGLTRPAIRESFSWSRRRVSSASRCRPVFSC